MQQQINRGRLLNSSSSSSNMWRIGDYEVKGMLGRGQFGEVFKVERNGQLFALKRVPLKLLLEGVPESTIREVSCLQEIHHPNLLPLYRVVVDPQATYTYLIIELMDLSLGDLMLYHPPQTKYQTKRVIYQVFRGLQWLNSHNIMHRDIKPDNILLKRDGAVKIADFGLARSYGLPSKRYTPTVITQWYRPPECLLNYSQYNQSIDIWSVGCLWVEMLRACDSGIHHNTNNPHPRDPTQLALFPGGESDLSQLRKIFETLGTPTDQQWPQFRDMCAALGLNYGVYESCPWEEVVPGLEELEYDLLSKMVVFNPEDRISAEEALNHPYFDDVRGTFDDVASGAGDVAGRGDGSNSPLAIPPEDFDGMEGSPPSSSSSPSSAPNAFDGTSPPNEVSPQMYSDIFDSA